MGHECVQEALRHKNVVEAIMQEHVLEAMRHTYLRSCVCVLTCSCKKCDMLI